MQSKLWGEGTAFKSQSVFMGWIRGGIRRALWNRSPVKINFINKYRKRIPNPNPRGKVATVWGATCALCNKDYPTAQVDVDHIKGGHSLIELEDIQKFVEGIVLVTESDLQFCCKTCHACKSYSDKMGISFEDARIEKEAIQIVKDKKDKEWLIAHNVIPLGNATKRREQILEVLRNAEVVS